MNEFELVALAASLLGGLLFALVAIWDDERKKSHDPGVPDRTESQAS